MSLSPKDIQKLNTCDPKLQLIVNELATEMPLMVLCGNRSKADQDLACAQGHSKTPYPTSKHDSMPSQAVDIAPLPLDWKNIEAFNKMMDAAVRIAEKLGIEIRLGRTFKTLVDMPHMELVQNKVKE